MMARSENHLHRHSPSVAAAAVKVLARYVLCGMILAGAVLVLFVFSTKSAIILKWGADVASYSSPVGVLSILMLIDVAVATPVMVALLLCWFALASLRVPVMGLAIGILCTNLIYGGATMAWLQNGEIAVHRPDSTASTTVPQAPASGTWFYGATGMQGPYIDDMIGALKRAGTDNPQKIPTSGRSHGVLSDTLNSALRLRHRDHSLPELNLVTDAATPLSLIGYSYGSLVATQEALDRADNGGTIDNLVLIGSPISREMLTQAQEHPNIITVIVIDLTEHGDPIHAGMTTGALFGSVFELALQFTGDPDGEGHFYYAREGPVGDHRRWELAVRLHALGVM